MKHKVKKIKYIVTDLFGLYQIGDIIDGYCLIENEGDNGDLALVYIPDDEDGCGCLCVCIRQGNIYINYKDEVYFNLDDDLNIILRKAFKIG